MTKSCSVNSQEKLFVLQQLLCLKLEDLFEKLDIGLACDEHGATGSCPIHDGDNPRAFTIYRTGDVNPGYWHCYTRHCEKIFQPTIIGFVRGMLSKQIGWTGQGDQLYSFADTLKWCSDFVGQDINSIRIDPIEVEKRRFAAGVNKILCKSVAGAGMTRDYLRSKLIIPAEYFIKRGWTQDVLNRYDVGLCDDVSKPFYNRIVVPIYDEQYKSSIGFVARSIFDKCNSCNLYHNPDSGCPTQEVDIERGTKWLNSKGFNRESYLYNYWFSRKHIADTGVVHICEGPGDVWRLEEAGIKTGVAIFGASLTDRQQILLETSGAMTVVVLTDTDEAGQTGFENIKKSLERSFRVKRPKFEHHDIGSMNVKQVRELLC